MNVLARTLAAAAVLAAAALLPAACTGQRSAARVHPERLVEAPRCGDCHETGDRAAFDHAPGWERAHALPARQAARTCELCHQPAFCAGCHGRREEIKPSDKGALEPGVAMPHRGDYTVQHRVDGRLDPASCFACHGRKNTGRCAQCHR